MPARLGAFLCLLLLCTCSEGRADGEPRRSPAARRPASPATRAAVPAPRPEDPRWANVSESAEGRWRAVDGLDPGALLPRRVVVCLPASYDEVPARRFPVLYVHDGQSAFENGYETQRILDALVSRGWVEPHVIVAIDATNDRSRELTPPERRWPWRTRARPSHLDGYGAFVVDVVKAWVDAHYRTRPDRASTATLGYSLGGLAACYLGLRHPQTFGRVACMSPSFWWGGRAAVRAFTADRSPLPARLWIDIGALEGAPRDVVPYGVADARAVRDAVLRRSMTLGRDLGYLEEPRTAHGFGTVSRRLRYALAFLLGADELLRSPPTSLSVYLVADSIRRGGATTVAVEQQIGRALRYTLPTGSYGVRIGDPRVVRLASGGRLVAVGRGRTTIDVTSGTLSASAAIEVR